MFRIVMGFLSVFFWVVLSVGCGGSERCEKDEDCPTKAEGFCVRGRCSATKGCFESCKENSDCAGCTDGKTVCLGGTCSKEVICPSTCSTTEDCRQCAEDQRVCVEGRCRAAPFQKVGYHERCGSVVERSCETGFQCVGSGASGYCIPECDATKRDCDDGKGICVDPHQTGGLCIPNGLAKQGDACSESFSGDPKLDPTRFCAEGLACQQATCQPPRIVGSYERCDRAALCDDQSSCVALLRGAPYGFCLPKCDPKVSACDGEKGRCVELSGGVGGCLPKGSAPEDASCLPPTSGTLTSAAFCAEGLTCISFTLGAICLKSVSACSEGACVSERVCLPNQSGGGICALRCPQGSSCPTGLRCEHSHAGGGHNDICIP